MTQRLNTISLLYLCQTVSLAHLEKKIDLCEREICDLRFLLQLTTVFTGGSVCSMFFTKSVMCYISEHLVQSVLNCRAYYLQILQ